MQQLSVINARVSVGKYHHTVDDNVVMFPKLSQLYLYLVQYLPSIDMVTSSVVTALHLILAHSPHLTSVQAPGSALMTDKCLLELLSAGKLRYLTKFVITQPISIDHRTVPLSQHSVTALHKTCHNLTLLGRHLSNIILKQYPITLLFKGY